MELTRVKKVGIIGAAPLRKKGIFAPFKEPFAPYEPRDYGMIVSGELNR